MLNAATITIFMQVVEGVDKNLEAVTGNQQIGGGEEMKQNLI